MKFEKRDLEQIADCLADKIGKQMFVVPNKPMARKEAAYFVGYCVSMFDRLVRDGKFRCHRPEDGADPRFIPSELIEDMKNWK